MLLLTQWEWVSARIPLPGRGIRGASCGVRQHGCRASRARDPVRGRPLPRLITGMPGVNVTITE
ncbi:MAG TPA: hypothetical protein DEF43_15425 [Chloroflexus aurantiacus]|nr:MAG: hypothetical protein D6716_09215 [Chloroflexota bacterium]HBW68508.1 hypothetical protein [Chloroflexus aurantiacus]